MSSKKIDLSLVLACYNEGEHFQNSIRLIENTLKASKLAYEIILVEDKSRDSTAELVSGFVKKRSQPDIKAIFHKRNEGRGKSVADGILLAKGEYAGYIDIDCEVSPSYIPLFVKKLGQHYDVVCGKRIYKTTTKGLIRALASRVYALTAKLLLGLKTPDSEAGYKFFDRKRFMPVLKTVKDKGWFWDTEVMVRSEKAGLRVASIPVLFNRRTDKTSTVNLMKDTMDYLIKLWQFRNELRNRS